MTLSFQIPEQGQLVDVRQRRYVVLNIKESSLPTDLMTSPTLDRQRLQHLVTLSSVEDDALGEELEVVWEIEPGATTIEKTPLPEPVGFDTPQRLDTFLNAVRWGAASSADVKAIQAPFRSGIDLEDYQLDPVARAIQMPRANLLIADDVGLGKTIEAGLVAQELIIRHRARRILIVCPAALQVQWHDQMRDKFGLEFRIVDSKALRELRRERGLHVNPWTHFPRLITSVDFLKRDRPLRLFTEILPPDGKPSYPRKFDLLIVDEAHNIAPSGQGKYATDSLRTAALRRLTPHFEHKLFLSATPHNGYSESFSALLELLDNQRFARGVKPDQEQLQAIMVRRLKSELPLDALGRALFPKRVITPLPVNYTPPEREIHQMLQLYNELRVTHSSDTTERYATEFVAKLLKKRLFSSPAAFLSTLLKHQSTLLEAQRHTHSGTRRTGIGILRSMVDKLDEEHDDDEALNEASDEALDTVAPLFHQPTAQELQLLQQMQSRAEDASHRPDSKAQCLIDWLKGLLKPAGLWKDERVIIFTEYRATQKWLFELLAREGLAERGPDGEKRLQTLYGGMDTPEREQIKAAFQANPAVSSVRILLATDAASEGIDLQNHCSRLIHYEIPWNPNRLEQRNGRVDRHGQQAQQVDIYHFVSSTYTTESRPGQPKSKLDADLEFLMTAVNKIEAIREDLGNVGPVIADQVVQAMLGRREKLETERVEKEAPSRRLQAFARKQRNQLKERIDLLYHQLQEGQRDLGLSPENIQAVVETALELAQQPPLIHDTRANPQDPQRHDPIFYLPELSGSWANCTDGLEHPHTKERRPLVFDHAVAKGRDDVVLAHLNHRLVLMALRLLRAEIWSHNERKLYRVTARTAPSHLLDAPAVIAHGRLLILGGDSQRLHEELIVAGGYLREGKFVRMTERQLKEAVAAAQVHEVSPRMKKDLADHWPIHQRPLIQALERRMDDRSNSLQKALADRAAKEQSDITTILTELKQNILKEIEQPEVEQQQLIGFSTDERDQYNRDLDALTERARQIDNEIVQEVERIRQRFAKPVPRLFPVAVTYLVPERLAR